MKTKCLLCTAMTEPGQEFYDHLEDVHMMPIRRERIIQPENWIHGMSLEKKGLWREETHKECMERFKFNHPEYGTDICWCPDRKSTRLNSSHVVISYAVFCLKKKNAHE